MQIGITGLRGDGLIDGADANTAAYESEPGTWGRPQVEQRIMPADGWRNPVMKTSSTDRTEVHTA
jgi:hypothetical protein